MMVQCRRQTISPRVSIDFCFHVNSYYFHFDQIIDYENRLRNFSTPDKIFRYFATVKVMQYDNTNIYMTPDDFLRVMHSILFKNTLMTESW